MMILCNNINWTAVESIATAVSAILTLIMLGVSAWQIYVLKRQRIEDTRPRLNFSVVVWDGLFLLKIKNIGKETAYDIDINFGGDLLDNHYSKHLLDMFRKHEQRDFIMEAGKEIYITISRRYSTGCTITYKSADRKKQETFHSQQINDWLDQHINDKILISGKYCHKYKIKESFSITDFVTDSIVYYDDITSELKKINIHLKKISDKNE